VAYARACARVGIDWLALRQGVSAESLAGGGPLSPPGGRDRTERASTFVTRV